MKNTGKKTENQTDPLVSIICRSINRPQLAEALRSVRSQTYKPVEIVLVDSLARGISKDLYRDCIDEIRIITPDQPLGRAAAANTGLDNAGGDYLMFLDDDDWIAPDHIAQLVNAVATQPDCRAVYSSVRKVTLDGIYTDEVFSQQYDPILLRRDNYIPIHAVLFSRSLIDDGCRFDETLNIYEDWDFWLQVSRLTDMRHLDSISAFYRQGGDSDTGEVSSKTRYASINPVSKARGAVLEKWKQIWSGIELNELLGSLDKSEDLVRLAGEIELLHRKLQILDDRLIHADDTIRDQAVLIDQNARQIDQLQHKLLASKNELATSRSELAASRSELENRSRQLLEAQQHAQELNNKLDAIYRSWTWRLMGPFRRTWRFLARVFRFNEH